MASALSNSKKLAKYNYELELDSAKKMAKLNNELEQKNVKLQYDYNKALAQQDRDWQERMANSAHQREIKDLKAAGLNPVLSVTGGSGAATPSGSSASVSKPNVDMSLPKAIMDMAIAQLNSATALQTTAMNNASAIEVVKEQGAQDRETKQTADPNSKVGLAVYLARLIPEVYDWATNHNSARFIKETNNYTPKYTKYKSIDSVINDIGKESFIERIKRKQYERYLNRYYRKQARKDKQWKKAYDKYVK